LTPRYSGDASTIVHGYLVLSHTPAPAVFLRQENQDIMGYTSFHVGNLVDKGRIVGSWANNRGESADFELVFVKE
jgi:hypothetical protein